MSEHQDAPEKRPRLNLTTSQVAASALAACCASIVASYLGVAGTVIGAAVGSVVATTGAAVYGHLFRHGGARLKQTLLVNGHPEGDAADAHPDAARTDSAHRNAAHTNGAHTNAAYTNGAQTNGAQTATARTRSVPGARFYGAQDIEQTRAAVPGGGTTAKLWLPASSTAERARTAVSEPAVRSGAGTGIESTRIQESGLPAGTAATAATVTAGGEDGSGPRRVGAITAIRRYRKPIGVAAAIAAVFCISITVGFLLGGPVRSAGSNSTPPASTTTATRTRDPQGGGQSPSTDPSASPSATPSGSASGTPSPSPAGGTSTGTPGASQSAGAGATGTGAAATASQQPHGGAGATNMGSDAP